MEAGEAVLFPLQQAGGEEPRQEFVVGLVAREVTIGGRDSIAALIIDEPHDAMPPIDAVFVELYSRRDGGVTRCAGGQRRADFALAGPALENPLLAEPGDPRGQIGRA